MSTTKGELLKTIRQKCLDCVCFQPKEVELCPSEHCVLWPYRMGNDPFKTPLSEKQREARMNALNKARDAKSMHAQDALEK